MSYFDRAIGLSQLPEVNEDFIPFSTKAVETCVVIHDIRNSLASAFLAE
jgi:hypothetical protein